MVPLALFAALALAPSCLLPPVDAPIVDPFRPPPCAWCPGNRGIEYDVPAGTPVRAAAAGDGHVQRRRRRHPLRRRRARRRPAGDLRPAGRRPVARPATASRPGPWSGSRPAGSTSASAAATRTSTPRRCSAVWYAAPGWCRPTARRARPAPPPRLRCPAGGPLSRTSVRRPAPCTLVDRPISRWAADPSTRHHLRSLRRRCAGPSTAEESVPWPSSPCDRCSRQVSTSGTRPGAGTRR